MASITKYAGTVSQTTGASFRTFSNLNNVKNGTTGSYATSSGVIKGKNSSPNRPSSVTCTNFGFNLPTGAEVSKVVVSYRHRKNKSGSTVCNIPAPTISLVGVSGFSGKGSAPTTSFVTKSKSWTTSKISRSQVNSSGFGVKIDYPSNTNSYEGTVSLSFVTVKVEYKVPAYSLGLKRVSGGYNGEPYTLELSISNKSLTAYNPSLTLSAPVGFSFLDSEGQGEVTTVNARTLTWNPKLTKKVGTSSVRLKFNVNVTFPSGVDSYSGTFSVVESLYSGSKSFTATIVPKPPSSGEETEPDAPPVIDDESKANIIEYHNVIANETISINISDNENTFAIIGFPVDDNNEVLLLEEDTPVYYNSQVTPLNWRSIGLYIDDYSGPFVDDMNDVRLKGDVVGRYVIFAYEMTGPISGWTHYWEDLKNMTPYLSYYFNVIPQESDLSVPFSATYTLSQEETNRLGDGHTYIVQTQLKHTTTDNYERNWYVNNRIQVTNTETTTSNPLTEPNTYENLEAEFTYDKNYPVTITINGDYTEATTYGYDIGTVEYTEPCIIQKEAYNGREPHGTYPTPINNLINNDDYSDLTLSKGDSSSPVILYELPLETGTNETLAIRGLQVRATIESTDNLIVMATLTSPNGNTGQRSIILSSIDSESQEDNELIIGGLGDLWGFTTLDMTNLEDWEVELTFNNLLENGEASISFNNVKIIFYVETVEHQEISVKIEDEDLAYYGAFIESVTIPEGLNTDTSFLTIDGTDTNDAYRQNIREKTITIEFNLSNCDIKTSTDMLRQLTKLFVNEKDKYNRPIPKKLWFSHYPTDYFEYIMEEPFEVNTEISDHTVKAKLTIPSGTSYSLEDTVTSIVGNANGLAAVHPTIRFKPNGTNIEIRETESNQTFNMGYAGDWNNKTVEIDCEDRTVNLYDDDEDEEPTDISKYVDHNTDWFRLYGEYSFEGLNCTILSVTFTERW